MASPEPKYQKTTLVGAAMDPATQAVWQYSPGGGGGGGVLTYMSGIGMCRGKDPPFLT